MKWNDRITAELRAADDRARDLVRDLTPQQLNWQPLPGAWSIGQCLEHLAPGVPTEALVLSPKGHVEHALYLVDDGEATWAHVEPGTAEELVGYLDRMRFWSKVEVEDLSPAYAVVLTPDVPAHLEADVRSAVNQCPALAISIG